MGYSVKIQEILLSVYGLRRVASKTNLKWLKWRWVPVKSILNTRQVHTHRVIMSSEAGIISCLSNFFNNIDQVFLLPRSLFICWSYSNYNWFLGWWSRSRSRWVQWCWHWCQWHCFRHLSYSSGHAGLWWEQYIKWTRINWSMDRI